MSISDLKKQVPNFLSSLRIALAISFPFIPVSARVPAIIVSLLSEFFDGYFARRWNAETALGQVLDPIADKLFVLTTVGVAISEGRLSWLHFTLVAMRDIVVAAGVLSVWTESKAEALRFLKPRALGKIATGFQFAFLLSLYVFDGLVMPIFLATAIISCISGADYLYGVLHRRFDSVTDR